MSEPTRIKRIGLAAKHLDNARSELLKAAHELDEAYATRSHRLCMGAILQTDDTMAATAEANALAQDLASIES